MIEILVFEQIGSGKVAEIRRIRSGWPGASKECGIRHLQPQRGPSAGGVAGEQASAGLGVHAVFLLEVRDQLFGQSLAPGAVIGRVGKLVRSAGTLLVEHHVNHLGQLAFRHPFRIIRSHKLDIVIRTGEAV